MKKKKISVNRKKLIIYIVAIVLTIAITVAGIIVIVKLNNNNHTDVTGKPPVTGGTQETLPPAFDGGDGGWSGELPFQPLG